MIYLLLCIISSSCIYVVFRLLKHYDVNTFQAIVFNYFFCVILGFFFLQVNGELNLEIFELPESLWIFSAIVGLMFIVVFYLMARTTQVFGVAAGSIVSRMSLVIPAVYAIIFYNEVLTWQKATGILLGLMAIYFIINKDKRKAAEGFAGVTLRKGALVLFPVLAFLGSGIVDTLVNIAKEEFVNGGSQNFFITFLFTSAFILGSILLAIRLVLKHERLEWRNLVWGIPLGTVNFFSVFFILLALSKSGLEGSVVWPINHVSIVALSTAIAALFFHEHLNVKNWIGFGLSLVAILLITFHAWNGFLMNI
ncbi:MAG: DMT family transporter [Bacteroidia bacterium]